MIPQWVKNKELKTKQVTFPTLKNNWEEYTEGSCVICKNGKIANLRLALKNGTANAICQLPEGYRPTTSGYYPITNLSNRTASVFYITNEGYVQIEGTEIGKIIFANVSFLTN